MAKKKKPKAVLPRFNVPISWKLLGSTIFVGTVAVAIAVSGLQRMNVLNEQLNQIVDVAAERVKLASLLRQYLLTVTRAEKNMIFAKSEEELQGYAKTIDELLERMDQHESKLRGFVAEEDRARLSEYSFKWRQWQANHQDVRSFSGVYATTRARELSLGEAHDAFERLDSMLRDLVADAEADLAQPADNQDNGKSVAFGETLGILRGIRHAVMDMQRAEKNMLLATSAVEMKRYEEQTKSIVGAIEQKASKFVNATDRADSDQFQAAEQAWQEYLGLNLEITRLAGEKASQWDWRLAYDAGRPMADESEALIDSIVRSNAARMNELKRSSTELYQRLRSTLIGFSIVGIGFSVAVSYFTGRRISRSLSSLASYAQNVRQAKDLSQPIPDVGRDEVGKLAEAFNEMRATVYRQTHELAKLNQTLKHKNDEMEQFVYTVSHDLKSPLVSCKGLLGLLHEDIADGKSEDVEDSIQRLEQATDQLSQIIDDLLALSRIGRKPLNLSEIDVSQVLATLRGQLADRIEAIDAELHVSDSLPQVVGDESDIKRVFENLLTNALKYTGDKAVIEVGGRQQDKELLFFVRDNGPGIEPEFHRKVFGLFQRIDMTKPGTGLGLASVQKIMRTHGGRVWVESQPDEGATFWLAFPWRKLPTK